MSLNHIETPRITVIRQKDERGAETISFEVDGEPQPTELLGMLSQVTFLFAYDNIELE